MKLKTIHRYLGVILSVVMLVVSITGVLLIYKKEYVMWSVPQAQLPLKTTSSEIAYAVDNILQDNEPGSVGFIVVHPEDLGLYKVHLKDRQYAFYDQSGTKLQQWGSNERLEDWILDLHHRLLLGNNIGLQIVGFGGIFLVLLVLIGGAIWWPRRRTYSVGLLPRSTQRGSLMMSHGNIGISSLVPFLIIAVSGVMLVYPRQSVSVFLEQPISRDHVYTIQAEDVPLKITQAIKSGDTLALLEYANGQFPNSTIRSISPSNQDYPEIGIGLQQAQGLNRLGNTRILFAKDSSIRIANALKQSFGKRVYDFIFPIHTAKLPLWYRILLSVFGLALALVSAFGLVSYLKSRFAKG